MSTMKKKKGRKKGRNKSEFNVKKKKNNSTVFMHWNIGCWENYTMILL